MDKSRFSAISFVVLTFFKVATADIFVIDNASKNEVMAYRDQEAQFGQRIPNAGLVGFAIQASPVDACSPMKRPPTNTRQWIAVIQRYGGCNFTKKVMHAMEANFSAAIIYNLNSDKLVPMGGDESDQLIPSVFIGYSDGINLIKNFAWPNNPEVHLLLLESGNFDINTYLLPFAIVVGICFIIMFAIVIYKCIQDHRRVSRFRLPKSALKKLPIHKFKNGDPYETCCICIEDYSEGDKLRILPCDHAYHSKCIDPWLLKNKRICPQCRKKVLGPGEKEHDEGSDSEETTSETAPLIGSAGSSRYPGGTFGAIRRESRGIDASSGSSSSASSSHSNSQEHVAVIHSVSRGLIDQVEVVVESSHNARDEDSDEEEEEDGVDQGSPNRHRTFEV